MNAIKLWFIVNWELFCRWLNRKEEFEYTIAFFIGMYFREKNQSNDSTRKQLDEIGIVDIKHYNGLITLYCLFPWKIDSVLRESLQKYLRTNVKNFYGMIDIKEYKTESMKSLHSYKSVCKDFNDNDDIQYDF